MKCSYVLAESMQLEETGQLLHNTSSGLVTLTLIPSPIPAKTHLDSHAELIARCQLWLNFLVVKIVQMSCTLSYTIPTHVLKFLVKESVRKMLHYPL